jgi:SAM-dependent methyltransferase
MNRTQRRAGKKLGPSAGPGPTGTDSAGDLFARASEHHRRGEVGAALALYKKVLALNPELAVVHERLALLSLAQGRPARAAAQYTDQARAMPQVLTQFTKVLDTLKRLLPDLAAALAARQGGSLATIAAKPAGEGGTSIAANPYFQFVLASTAMRDHALELWLTALRADFLDAALAGRPAGDDLIAFAGALARQCFINEYVFNVTPAENDALAKLTAIVAGALANKAGVSPLQLATLAMYTPLHTLADAAALTELALPAPVAAVVAQQVREPLEEQALRATIPRLTEIGDGVTAEVRQQYEENPYPRWVLMAQPPNPLMVLDDHLRHQFPTTPFRPTGARDSIDVLVAGSGTGRYALEFAQSFRGARVLGVDLSLSSLTHAKRKIPPTAAGKVEFAQGDILKLGAIEKRFDLVSTTGVLHHMDDPLGGWRALIKLMKPDGLMQVGLYSAHARKEIVAARKLIAERGYAATPEGIRQCRMDLLAGPEQFKFMGLRDFFSISECRDLMFHVHERQFTIPEIKDFLAANDLKFVGFEFSPQDAHMHHREVFARAGWLTSDLDRWDAYERANPDIFGNMYIFWVQKINP